MIKAINLSNRDVKFKAKPEKKQEENESKILPNTLETRLRQKFDKTTSAFTEYPKKGLLGDVNSDFYEFLSMGIIPYLVGSGMFMGVFNLVNNHLMPKSKKFASAHGHKMALGVVLYGTAKTLANDLVTRPIAKATGVDIELPYRHDYYPLPTEPGANANVYPLRQHRKVYDSSEFFRKDLIASDPEYGIKYYDKIAKKNGLGENLNDSATEVTPIIQSVISTAKTAKSLSSYAWAGAGVGLAMQDSWKDFFDSIANRKRHVPKKGEGIMTKIGSRMKNAGSNFVDISKTFGKSFVRGCKTLWTGEPGTKGYMKHAGKAWILFASALTVGSVANSIYRARSVAKLVNKDIIEQDKESMVI